MWLFGLFVFRKDLAHLVLYNLSKEQPDVDFFDFKWDIVPWFRRHWRNFHAGRVVISLFSFFSARYCMFVGMITNGRTCTQFTSIVWFYLCLLHLCQKIMHTHTPFLFFIIARVGLGERASEWVSSMGINFLYCGCSVPSGRG